MTRQRGRAKAAWLTVNLDRPTLASLVQADNRGGFIDLPGDSPRERGAPCSGRDELRRTGAHFVDREGNRTGPAGTATP
ncbi:MAG: hypothetical protein OXB98_10395 [Bryobacterales bacterium]|nr:hypothetical protein [Bryobacterales bacterium]